MLSPLLSQATTLPDKPVGQPLFWYEKPLRIMHTVLREIDARNDDARAVVDYLKKGAIIRCASMPGVS